MHVPDGIDTAGGSALPAGDGRVRLLLAGALLAGLLPLLAAPVLPLIDLYNHVVRYDVLARLGDDPLLAANYAAHWALLPNMGLDVLALLLLQLLPALWLPHVLVTLIFAALLGGILLFNRALTGAGHPLVLILALPLLYSWVLNWGFMNFLFGLGLAFLAAGLWWHGRDRPWPRLAVAVPVATLIFLCHGVAFALYGLLIAALAVGDWSRAPDRRVATLLRGLLPCAVQAVVPAVLFAMSQTVRATQGMSGAGANIVRHLQEGTLLPELAPKLLYRLETVVRVAEGPSYRLDALWLAALAVLLALLVRRRLIRLSVLAWPAIAVAALLVLFCPPALFGVGSIADRMPLFLALLLVASVQTAPGLALSQPVVIGITALVVVRLASIALLWHGTAADLADLDRVAARLPPGRLVAALIVDGTRHADVPNRCDVYLHVLALRHRQMVPIFASRFQQPIAMVGPLARAAAASQASFARFGVRPSVAEASTALASGYDHALACAAQPARPLPAMPYPILARSGRFALLQLKSKVSDDAS